MQVRFERRLDHPLARVWALVGTPEGLSRWFPARVTFARLAVGEPMTFVFQEADLDRAAEHGVEEVPESSGGVITEVESGRVFAFDWLGEPIRIELALDGDGCGLHFVHVFDRDEVQAPRNGAGWHVCLEALTPALDGRTEETSGPSEALERAYREAFSG